MWLVHFRLKVVHCVCDDINFNNSEPTANACLQLRDTDRSCQKHTRAKTEKEKKITNFLFIIMRFCISAIHVIEMRWRLDYECYTLQFFCTCKMIFYSLSPLSLIYYSISLLDTSHAGFLLRESVVYYFISVIFLVTLHLSFKKKWKLTFHASSYFEHDDIWMFPRERRLAFLLNYVSRYSRRTKQSLQLLAFLFECESPYDGRCKF